MKPDFPLVFISLLEGTAASIPKEARIVAGASATDVPHLLVAVARALDFPEYFGGNWDALDECLSDLEWLPTRPALLAFRDAGQVLRQSLGDRAVLLQILADAGAGNHLRIVFQDQPEALQPWRELCENQHIPTASLGG